MGNQISTLIDNRTLATRNLKTFTDQTKHSNNFYEQLQRETSNDRDKMVKHELFSNVKNLKDVKIFMENHSYAVYDYMTLLKSLQQRFTCVKSAWAPPKNQIAARLINEIVLAEETDEIEPKAFMSHYELYLKAMTQLGANTKPVIALTKAMEQTNDPKKALKAARNEGASDHALKFLEETFQISFDTNIPDYVVATYFLFARKDPIPDMFRMIQKKTSSCCSDNSNVTLLLAFDYSSAFDTVDHTILLRLLERISKPICLQNSLRRAVEHCGNSALSINLSLLIKS
ncbi:hypothetical protein HELRODRAFT_165336 [Helobdella robusta]|uniref:Uncharacterized protein n=1 Tax=Helobdella robusta TaxID=6412 RepID=T1EWL9_HELRO|nr:hypothetical protein HELRODRAFT_165336 [Helobdella robusta]ESN91322.1 hypothetical protein HELRODRAFT_165336 [Helobdella robusta]